MLGCVAKHPTGLYDSAMPYQPRPGGVFLTRIGNRRLSCGTRDSHTADLVEQFARWLVYRSTKERLALEVLTGKIPLVKAFDYHNAGRLDDLLIVPKDDPDLVPLLREWSGGERYKLQVGRLITGHFFASEFTRKRVAEFLSSLPVTGSTKNRHRAALSSFARWLVEREVLDHNPVRDVRMSRENPARMTWLEREDAKSLILAVQMPYRAAIALMAATGMELQAVERVRRRDVDLVAGTVRARGGKNYWRDRVVRGTEPWAWAIFAEYVRDFLPDALVFENVNRDTIRSHHHRASKLLGLPKTTLHDWRHSYAVWSLRDGLAPTVVARQLGHKDTMLLQTVYGRFVPDERDFDTHATRASRTLQR